MVQSRISNIYRNNVSIISHKLEDMPNFKLNFLNIVYFIPLITKLLQLSFMKIFNLSAASKQGRRMCSWHKTSVYLNHIVKIAKG